MTLYCIDKNHQLYGRKLRIDDASSIEDGTRYIDALTEIPFPLTPSQISLYPPTERSAYTQRPGKHIQYEF